jgi:carbon-monoxide dehydrogenase large subunit
MLSGSFQDYCMPRADNLPSFDMQTHPVPSTDTPMRVKGCGEVGSIGAPAAIINAVVDALSPYKIRHLDMPATPARIWRAIADNAMPMAAE